MSASKSASGVNGVAGAHSTSRRTKNILAPIPQQATMLLRRVNKPDTNFDEVIEDFDELMFLSESIVVNPCPSSGLVFPILLLDSTIDLLQSHFSAVERQQDSCPEISLQSSP